MNFTANVDTSIVQTLDGLHVWLTIVTDSAEADPQGIQRGWHTAQPLDADSAAKNLKSFLCPTC
jgi:hypothetical protein